MFELGKIEVIVACLFLYTIFGVSGTPNGIEELNSFNEQKLVPLKSVAEKQASSAVFGYLKNALDQAEQTLNTALNTAKENQMIQRLVTRIRGARQKLGLPLNTNLLPKS